MVNFLLLSFAAKILSSNRHNESFEYHLLCRKFLHRPALRNLYLSLYPIDNQHRHIAECMHCSAEVTAVADKWVNNRTVTSDKLASSSNWKVATYAFFRGPSSRALGRLLLVLVSSS